jgi:hypothetical protein
MKPKKSRKQINIETQLRLLLAHIYEPKIGLTIEEITKTIHAHWRFMAPDQFRRESKYIERILGVMRHEIYEDYIGKKLEIQQNDPDHAQVLIRQIPPPDFLPFALKQSVIYWKYFNCVRRPYTGYVERLQRIKADGLIKTADLMDEMFHL